MDVTSRDDWSSSAAALDGMLIPSPPSLAGRANNVHWRSLGGGLPVRAGMRSERMASSIGLSRGPMSGVVRLR